MFKKIKRRFRIWQVRHGFGPKLEIFTNVDSFKLCTQILQELQKGNTDKALELIRIAWEKYPEDDIFKQFGSRI
jgi:hypothetical protein